MRNASKLRRGAGAMLLAAALALVAVPTGAAADDTVTTDVEFAVSLHDGITAHPLAGAQLTVRATTEDTPDIASGVAGPDGTVVLTVTGVDTSYIVDAKWPGAQGDMEDLFARAEFNLSSDELVAVRFWGAAAAVSGNVILAVDGQRIEDASSARVSLRSGGIEVQSLPVAADGTYASSALPASTTADYSVGVTVPAGYEFASEQPENAAFALPGSQAGLAEHRIDRSFALTRPGATPDPNPEPGTGEPVPAPPVAPGLVLGGGLATGPEGSADLGAALGGISEGQLGQLIANLDNPAGDGVVISNGLNQVIGVAITRGAVAQGEPSPILTPVVAFMPEVFPRGGSEIVAADLETLLLTVQGGRNQLIDQQLAEQIEFVQRRNHELHLLNVALDSVSRFVQDPSDASFAAASDGVRAANVQHPFLAATGDERVAQAALLQQVLRSQLNQSGASQQMDMLRLQSLTSRRNDSADLISALQKKLLESRSTVVGNMRSTPVTIGSVQWNAGTVSGAFDLSRVASGNHHLILNFQGAGVTTISEVTVGESTAAERDTLAVTGGESDLVPFAIASVLLLLGGAALVASRVGGRHGRVATRS